jgi:acetyl/propionyl-CoA carboxylase alpha subunit
MGIASVAVHSDADADAPHVGAADEAVRIGPAPAAESYLDIGRVIDAARRVGADAVHPGYGFLSENAEFAAACGDAGIVFIGPSPEAIRRMGDKLEAKALMREAGVPVIPGVAVSGRPETEIGTAAAELGFPLLVKAAAGGGGKGMRVVRSSGELMAALEAARREAEAAFGNGALLLERHFEAARHVEIQIFGDEHGEVVHCFERECSVQRRYQKILEEAPSVAVDEPLRRAMGAAAVAAGKAIGYVGAGTVEFLLDRSGDFYFLEVNTRLQVEHPVIASVTGLDLVRWQIGVARGEPLPRTQQELSMRGHAIEARLYAEDPVNGFLPATGRLALWRPPRLPGVRVDAGVDEGSEVGIHYDPLLAKLVAHAADRSEAIQRLRRALSELAIGGLATNRDFLIDVLDHPAFVAGDLDTRFVERHLPAQERSRRRKPAAERSHAIAAAVEAHERRRGSGPLPASIPSGWRNNRWRPQDVAYRLGREPDAPAVEVLYVAEGPGRFQMEVAGEPSEVRIAQRSPGALSLEIDGVRRRYALAVDGDGVFVHADGIGLELVEVPRFPRPRGGELAGGCLAPMPGTVRQVNVAAGDRVEAGSVLLVLEAMKMEHQLVAHEPGVVKEVRVEVGDTVEPDAVLVVMEAGA